MSRKIKNKLTELCNNPIFVVIIFPGILFVLGIVLDSLSVDWWISFKNTLKDFFSNLWDKIDLFGQIQIVRFWFFILIFILAFYIVISVVQIWKYISSNLKLKAIETDVVKNFYAEYMAQCISSSFKLESFDNRLQMLSQEELNFLFVEFNKFYFQQNSYFQQIIISKIIKRSNFLSTYKMINQLIKEFLEKDYIFYVFELLNNLDKKYYNYINKQYIKIFWERIFKLLASGDFNSQNSVLKELYPFRNYIPKYYEEKIYKQLLFISCGSAFSKGIAANIFIEAKDRILNKVLFSKETKKDPYYYYIYRKTLKSINLDNKSKKVKKEIKKLITENY